MTAADMQLVRDNVPGGYNLAVGEPYFLQWVYRKWYPHWFVGGVTYPQLKGQPDLLTELQKRHPGKHIVVANGAKQGLLAAAHALRQVESKSVMTHQAPYWPTYPTIAKLTGVEFWQLDDSVGYPPYVMRVTSSPNNPDGRLTTWPRRWDIWDAAYADPVYGWDGKELDCRISVWSAAKLFGVSGYRVGWLVTDSEKLASAAATYVEQTTSGVSIPSQNFLSMLLHDLETRSPEEVALMTHEAQDLLLKTSRALAGLSYMFHEVRGFPATRQGMFAWVFPKDPDRFTALLEKAKVKVVGGEFCGGSRDWFRISLGVLPETMQAAVKVIQEADDGSAQ